MNQIFKNLEIWFTRRPRWLQDAARRIIQKGALDSTDLADLIALCKQEAGVPDSLSKSLRAEGIPSDSLQVHDTPFAIRLEEISNVKGINALSPRKPLEFGEGPLTIIYGGTGSGKSGYVRILKHACGAKSLGVLHGNVFDHPQSDRGCTLKVKIGTDSKDLDWSPDTGVLQDIAAVEIYDSDCANIYLTEENEVAYEPWALSLLTQLTNVCTYISKTLKEEIDHSVSVIPIFPVQYWGTKSASWYLNLGYQTKQSEINARCLWNRHLEKSLTEFERRLSAPDPAKQAAQLRITKANLLNLHNELNKSCDQLSDKKSSQYLRAKEIAIVKRKAADEDAKKVFENAPLDGVGSESWRLLWEQARVYSENIAYQGIPFPNLSEEARCVLCHQILEKDARDRFQSFENFVKGELQRQANEAEEQEKILKKDIEDTLSTDRLDLYMDSAGVTTDKEREEISTFHRLLLERRDSLLKSKTAAEVAHLPNVALLQKLKDRSDKLERRATKYDEDAKKEKRDELRKYVTELEARKQLSELKAKIEEEILRLNYIHTLEKARKSTNPKPLSDKKSSLAGLLISPAFIKRFEDELTFLGAGHFKVTLAKTRTEYGRVFHKIQLNGCTRNIPPTEVLSDGEFRIVSLAAFLSDVEGRPQITPFIFDDPITSVDQDFEEATTKRLIELARLRQVIVFTHRLSFLAQLEDEAEKAGIEPHIICLRHETWGAGEPGETLISEKKPKNALSFILHNRLPIARKILQEKGYAEYENIAKGICGDIRILIERLIENDLLSDVVKRFRRQIYTKDKLHNLAKINSEDCKLLDKYMTEYSKYEHSQPSELPVKIPDPDKIERDLTDILGWLAEFQKR